jgi:hypothetical protein
MRVFALLILFTTNLSLHGQVCKDSISNYLSIIDTTQRKVVLFAEEMPDLFDNDTFFNKLSKEIKLNELSCCPIYVWYAFIVEIDGTLSNMIICPQFISCDSQNIEEENSKILKNQFNRLFKEIRTNPAKIDGKPVAIAYISKIHYECMDGME